MPICAVLSLPCYRPPPWHLPGHVKIIPLISTIGITPNAITPLCCLGGRHKYQISAIVLLSPPSISPPPTRNHPPVINKEFSAITGSLQQHPKYFITRGGFLCHIRCLIYTKTLTPVAFSLIDAPAGSRPTFTPVRTFFLLT